MGIIFLLVAALIYSLMPVLIRLLNEGHLPTISQVFLRYIFAFLAAAVYFFGTKAKLKIQKRDLPLFLALGVLGYGLTNLLFTYGILLTKISTALFIFYCFGIVTPILAIIFLKEKFNFWNLLALALGLASLLLLFRPTSFNTWKIGALFALAAAFTQSGYLIGRKFLASYSSEAILLTSTFLGALSAGFLAVTFESDFYSGGGLHLISGRTWLLTVLFGLLNFSAWFLMSRGFEKVKATTGGLVLLLENFFAVSLAFLFFAEVPSLTTFMGGFLIVAATILVILKGEKN